MLSIFGVTVVVDLELLRWKTTCFTFLAWNLQAAHQFCRQHLWFKYHYNVANQNLNLPTGQSQTPSRMDVSPWLVKLSDVSQGKMIGNKNGVLRRQCGNRSEIIRKVWVLQKCESSYLTFRNYLRSKRLITTRTFRLYSNLSDYFTKIMGNWSRREELMYLREFKPQIGVPQ